MDTLTISFESLLIQFQDGSAVRIPMWLFAGASFSQVGLVAVSILAIVGTIFVRGNRPEARAATD